MRQALAPILATATIPRPLRHNGPLPSTSTPPSALLRQGGRIAGRKRIDTGPTVNVENYPALSITLQFTGRCQSRNRNITEYDV